MIAKLLSAPHFYRLSSKCLPYTLTLGVILTVVGIIWGLVFAPADYQQGNSFRIIYIHVSSASLALIIYACMSLAAAIFLIWRIQLASIFQIAAAPIGASLCLLALVTGAIWGKPTWGAWWVWDARLTSMLILGFIYFGLILLSDVLRFSPALPKILAIITLVGSVNLPIIKYSVSWWNTLHQPATFTLTQAPKMASEMYIPLLLTVIGFIFLFGSFIGASMRYRLLIHNPEANWVKDVL